MSETIKNASRDAHLKQDDREEMQMGKEEGVEG